MADEIVGTGGQSEGVAWHNDTVLKLFRRGMDERRVKSEFHNALAAFNVGIPTPKPMQILESNGRSGIVFERVQGPSLLEIALASPEHAAEAGVKLADLHHSIHSRSATELPSQSTRLRARIERAAGLDEVVRAELIAQIVNMQGRLVFCHGDFHPGNVMVSPQRSVILDWYDATSGFAEVDVARTVMLLRFAEFPGSADQNISQKWEACRTSLLQSYCARYSANNANGMSASHQWQQVVIAARLAEPISENERNRLADWMKLSNRK